MTQQQQQQQQKRRGRKKKKKNQDRNDNEKANQQQQPQQKQIEFNHDDKIFSMHCKRTKIFEYDTSRYPFRELLSDWLQLPSTDCLENIQNEPTLYDPCRTTSIHPKICKAWKDSKTLPKLSSKARHLDGNAQTMLFTSKQYYNFVNTYRLFIREVILPLCYDNPPSLDSAASVSDNYHCDNNNNHENESNDSTNKINHMNTNTANTIHDMQNDNNMNIVYQCPPTTRVVLPNGKPTISIHCDKEYSGHQEGEINFWMPVTNRVYGSNTLWVESQPNIGDFKPVELTYGQCLRFDGYNCRHYTTHNTTKNCRVSFDFRVIPSKLCTARTHIGDFCVEETTKNGYIAYPHPFMSAITKTRDPQQGKRNNGRNGEQRQHQQQKISVNTDNASLLASSPNGDKDDYDEIDDNTSLSKIEHHSLSSILEYLNLKR